MLSQYYYTTRVQTGQEAIERLVKLKDLRSELDKEMFWDAYFRLRRKFYNSEAWCDLKKKIRKTQKYCQVCEKRSRFMEVHHKIFIFDDPLLALDEENCQLVCRPCHLKIHKK